jgi:hypothetical protein
LLSIGVSCDRTTSAAAEVGAAIAALGCAATATGRSRVNPFLDSPKPAAISAAAANTPASILFALRVPIAAKISSLPPWKVVVTWYCFFAKAIRHESSYSNAVADTSGATLLHDLTPRSISTVWPMIV